MRLEDVREILCGLTEMFFQNATVVWAEQSGTRPNLPYVTLKTKGIQKSRFPVTSSEGKRFYHASTIFEVNLYTQGRRVNVEENATFNYENTAVSDMCDFCIFLESENITDQMALKNIEVSLNSDVRDLSELMNETSYRYRAMIEARVSFIMKADGPYGLSGMETVPSPSGGAIEEYRDAEQEIIEKTDIKEGENT